MQDNPNTSENERKPLDTEDWEIAFEPYKGNSGAALMLGFHLMILKSYLVVRPIEIHTAIEALDRAVDVLFPHTQFHEFSFELFVKVTNGMLTVDEQELLKSLGLEF